MGEYCLYIAIIQAHPPVIMFQHIWQGVILMETIPCNIEKRDIFY